MQIQIPCEKIWKESALLFLIFLVEAFPILNKPMKSAKLFFFRLFEFKIDFSSCSHQNLKKRIILRVPTFLWGNWICNQISKIFILKFWFFYTFCKFWRSRIKPRILKIVFFFLHHGGRWTFWQYGAVLCFLARKVLGKNGSNIHVFKFD